MTAAETAERRRSVRSIRGGSGFRAVSIRTERGARQFGRDARRATSIRSSDDVQDPYHPGDTNLYDERTEFLVNDACLSFGFRD